MAAETCISGTRTVSVEIPVTNCRFSTIKCSAKVSANDCDNNRQPEISNFNCTGNFISGCRSLLKLLGHTLSNSPCIKTLDYVVGISALYVIFYLTNILYFWFWRPYSCFRLSVVVALTYGHFISSWLLSKMVDLSLKFRFCDFCLSQIQRY